MSPNPNSPHEALHLVLYICADGTRGAGAVLSVEALIATLPGARLDVVDVRTDPAAAEAARVVATPTLVRRSPGPARRIVGDLSDRTLIRRLLLDGAVTDEPEEGEEQP